MDMRTAKLGIAKILCELERDTGSVVKQIELEALDVTRVDSQAQELAMSVRIDLERLPSHSWFLGEKS